MPYDHDTFDRRVQLGASRRRREDAEHLCAGQRWAGAMYLGGYAIECSLKSLICYYERKNNFKDTKIFSQTQSGATLHNLTLLLDHISPLKRAIENDRTGRYKNAWNTITSFWQKDGLRYYNYQGDQQECTRFIAAMQLLHQWILHNQGETS